MSITDQISWFVTILSVLFSTFSFGIMIMLAIVFMIGSFARNLNHIPDENEDE